MAGLILAVALLLLTACSGPTVTITEDVYRANRPCAAILWRDTHATFCALPSGHQGAHRFGP